MKKILSIDGGGVRGIIAVKVLKAIEEEMQELITSKVSLVAGTSTGAIIAGGIASAIPMGNMLEHYKNISSKIFECTMKRKLSVGFGLWGSKYDSRNLEKAVKDVFGNKSLSDVHCDFLAVSYNITKARAEFLTRRKDRGLTLAEAIVASSSAPTYFDAKKINNNDYIDGGIVANNPSMAAFTEIKTMYNARAEDILTISIGNGASPKPIGNTFRWSALKWVKSLIDIAINADTSITHTELVKIYQSVGTPGNYFRVNEYMPNNILVDMNDASPKGIKTLMDFGDYVVSKNKHKIIDIAENLK